MSEQIHNQQSLELLVIEGQRSGARAPVKANGVTTVGTGLECDIVLASAQADLTHTRIDITREGEQCQLLVVEGTVSVNQNVVQTGESLAILPDTPITLGGSVFTLVAETPAITATGAEKAQMSSLPVRKRSRFATYGVTAVIGLCFIVAGVASYISSGENQTVTLVERPSLEALLASEEFDQIAVSELSDGTQTIEGRVRTRSAHMQLKAILQENGFSTDVDVSIDEVFLEDVAAIYRLNGIDAEVQISAPGEVTVKTAVADDPFLEEVEARAYQDVPGLIALNRVNTPPPIEEPDKPTTFNQMPGKRIKMVVTSEPAFILTEDGSRYFIGAILPSGYKIKSIYEKTVQLERDNKIVDLVF